MKVATTEEMRAMDRYAIETLGIADEILMENAGIAAYYALAGEMDIAGGRFAVFCGGGNNGGDGFVVARKIHSGGGIVKVFLLAEKNRYKGAARKNLDRLLNLPVDVRPVESVDDVRGYILQSNAVIDAIFGTGLDRDVEGLHREVIEIINAIGKPVYSLDIPSGVNGDTGRLMGTAIRAAATVTFGLPKRGNLLYPGFLCGGKLYVTHISLPPELYDSESIGVEVNDPPPLPARKAWGHKGDFGDVLFVAGAAGYYGAPAFSALSFLKAGGGYSRLAAPASVIPGIAAQAGEIVFVPQRETASGSIALRNKAALLELAGRVDMVVLGPGLSLAEETQKLVRELAAKIEKPIVIDGDGITAIAKNPRFLKRRRYETVLTPHAGEMSRIAGKSRRRNRERPHRHPPGNGSRSRFHHRAQGGPLARRLPRRPRLDQHERQLGDGDGGIGRCADGGHRGHVRPGASGSGGGEGRRVCPRAGGGSRGGREGGRRDHGARHHGEPAQGRCHGEGGRPGGDCREEGAVYHLKP